ncbi:uncharacterized protein LOC143878770 [Tasmannia lanceolata]|uniref:uncharacterized protein LOC143878770 n=1 Tax=Tasmannia lanceolata TaxID=3420 RepID=UPI004062F542
MEFSKKLRRFKLSSSIAFICVLVAVSCMLVLLISMLRLPDVSLERGGIGSYRALQLGKRLDEEERVGELAEEMIGMLPNDLAFTVFLPSEKAFEHDLRLQANDSLVERKANNTFAILSRVLGFSAISQHLLSGMVPMGKEISLDSISGFKLYASRASDGSLFVNTVRAKRVDIKRGEIIVHVMTGVIMDAEFEQSFQPDYEDEG